MAAGSQRFEGKTLESALGAAVEALGPDLEVKDARRIRVGGVGGFFAREHYEVIAAPRGGEEVVDEVVDEATVQRSVDKILQALAEGVQDEPPSAAGAAPDALAGVPAADDGEPSRTPQPGSVLSTRTGLPGRVRGTPDPRSSAEAAPKARAAPEGTVTTQWGPNAYPESDSSPDPGPSSGASEGQWAGVAQASSLTPRSAGEQQSQPSTSASPSDFQTVLAEASASRSRSEGEPKWSLDALQSLGVPSRVIRHLEGRVLGDDLSWIGALAHAIAEEVPPPGSPGPDALVCVSGYGPSAAAPLLLAAIDGLTPSVLYLDGRPAAASATELALAVRSCLPR